MKNLPEFSEKRNFDDQKTEKFSDLMFLIRLKPGQLQPRFILIQFFPLNHSDNNSSELKFYHN